jgi:hypothetical protein
VRLVSQFVPGKQAAFKTAYVAGLPPRFWTRNSDAEIEHVGLLDENRLTNLGTVELARRGFKVTASARAA